MVSGTFCPSHRDLASGFGNRILPGTDHRCVYCDEPCDGRLYGVNNVLSQECESRAFQRRRAAEHPCEPGCVGVPGHRYECWPKKEQETT